MDISSSRLALSSLDSVLRTKVFERTAWAERSSCTTGISSKPNQQVVDSPPGMSWEKNDQILFYLDGTGCLR